MTNTKNYLNSINLNINTDFPYLFLNVIKNEAYPKNPGFQVMHWHNDLQFIYILEGEIIVQTLDDKIIVEKIPERKQKDITSERMQLFLNYIENNYSDNISLDKLAKSANVSKSECLRCFKKSLNTTPYKYLLEYRLAKAVKLLNSSNESISEISLKVGFNQTSHFCKYFREKIGFSPLIYRKNSSVI